METAIVFDWDDTLFPTSQYSSDKTSLIYRWRQLDNSLINLLTKSLKYKNVYIITNATKQWLYYCINTYCPRFKNYLKYLQGVISARDNYNIFYPNDVVMWKTMSILDILETNKNIGTIVFASDLDIDFQALYKVKKIKPQLRTKTYKFRASPRICQLIKQQTDFARFLDYIILDRALNNYDFYRDTRKIRTWGFN